MRKFFPALLAALIFGAPAAAIAPPQRALVLSAIAAAPNQLNNSQAITAVNWTLVGTPTITDNVTTAPDGTLTGASMVFTGASQATRQQVPGLSTAPTNVMLCASFYIKAATDVSSLLQVADVTSANYFRAAISPHSGAIFGINVTGAGNVATYGIVPAAGGWFRVWVSGRLGAAGPYFVIQANPGTSSGTIFLWGAQMEVATSSCPGPYRYKP